MSQSLSSCPLCGEPLADQAAKACPKCGGRLAPEIQRPLPEGGKSRVGDYFIECHIGSGGMGEVYLARQISMKREVALKILQRELCSDTKYLERFFREVRLLAQIEHPNVVRAIEAGMEGDTCYFSMEYAHGKDLKRQIDLGRRFEEPEALRIGCEIASALKYAWDKHKLIHRDVKPANVILTPDGEVKLMDLGISKRQFENSDITLAGMMVGSPTYISPEQARAEKDMDFRADMYSLGASLFHMLAGQPPYDADSPVAVISMHLSAPIPDLGELRPDLSKATVKLITRMLAKQKEQRFASWNEAMEQMRGILERRQAPRLRDGSPEATQVSQPRVELSAAKGEAAEGFLGVFSKLIEWPPSILKAQPKHRLIALSLLLLIMLAAFASVVNYSVRTAKSGGERRSLQAALNAAAQCTPENRPVVIGRLELIAKNSSPEVKAAALGGIERLRRRSLQEQESEESGRRKNDLKDLKERSFQLESKGDFGGALRLWNDFANSTDFKNDPKVALEIKNAREYLRKKRQEKEAGLVE